MFNPVPPSDSFYTKWFTKIYNKQEEIDKKLDLINTRLNQLTDLEMKLNAIIKKSNRVYDKQSVYNQPIVEAVPASNTTTDEPQLTPEQLFAMLREIQNSEEFAEYVKTMQNPPEAEFYSNEPDEPTESKGEDQ